jgi:hypothetical protein
VNRNLWAIFVVVGAILGFMMGYATAPMVETGMFSDEPAGPKTKATEDVKQYYEDLYKRK